MIWFKIMEILILILVVVGGWVLFKIIIPSIQMTRDQMKDIGEASKYVKSDDPIVSTAVDKTKFKYVVNKYKKMGYTEAEAKVMARDELRNN